MKYTIKDLKRDFPNDSVCLDYIFKKKHPKAKGYYRVKDRKCYSHQSTRHQIHPLKGTIFEKSSTSLTMWFHVIFLFATSKNGVSAKEIERQTGVTYKCAWRMAHQIRSLMKQGKDPLTGTIEVDETYLGGYKRMDKKMENKSAIMGMVERGGRMRAKKVENRKSPVVLNEIKENVSKDATIMTDEWRAYKNLSKLGYANQRVKHGKGSYVRGSAHTNSIEGFWGQFKRSVHGTHHYVSPKHLQRYLDEFAFRYSFRASSAPMFEVLLQRV